MINVLELDDLFGALWHWRCSAPSPCLLAGNPFAGGLQLLASNLRVLLHVGPNQDTWTPEPSLWTMTWRVHNVTSRTSQVFDTFEGLLQIHNMPRDAVPQLTDETAQAGFSHACSVPTRDGEGSVIPSSSRLLILALSQAVFRRRHPLFLVGDGLLNLSQLMPLSRALCPVQTRRFQIRRRVRRHQFPKNVQLSFFQFLAILLLTTTPHVLGQLRPQKSPIPWVCNLAMSASSPFRRRAFCGAHAAFPSMSFARCWGSEHLLIELFLTSFKSSPDPNRVKANWILSIRRFELSSFLRSQTSPLYQQKDRTQQLPHSPQSPHQPCPRHCAAHSQSPSERSV